MTPEAVREIAQADPVANLSARWGDLTVRARNRVAALEDALRELDKVTEQLAAHQLVVATDLGVTGNAARKAYLMAHAGNTPGFRLPKTEADRLIAEFKAPHRTEAA